MMAYGPIETFAPIWAPGSIMAVGWMSVPPLRQGQRARSSLLLQVDIVCRRLSLVLVIDGVAIRDFL
jgi:hypothetical protein